VGFISYNFTKPRADFIKRTGIKMKMKLFHIFILVLLLSFFGCDQSDKPARGFEDEIFVVADSAEYDELKEALALTFEKEIFTPQPEKTFTLIRIDPSNIEQHRRKKNIIITAPLNSESKASEFLKNTIDTSITKKLESETDFIVYKTDLWAKGQLVTLLSAPTMQELEFKILKNSDNLLYAYQKKSDERLFNNLYNPRYEQLDIEGNFLKDYGWVIYVQADYKVAFNKPGEKFVWLRRSPGSDMERWIFIHWIDNATPEYLNADSIKTIRNRVTKKFYQTTGDSAYVIVAEDYFTTNEVNFNSKYAIFTQGLWDLNVKGMGGPFVNYTFYDESTQRFYMIDGSVYAPKYYKRNLIQQMDVTLQSFRTLAELTEDRKEELLDAASN
jgi:hypothetical protein